MIDLSIVIINYKTVDLTIDCIKSILRHSSTLKLEIIVIDNGSEGDEGKQIESCFHNIKVVQNRTNEGFGKANNQGIAIAEGKYILLLNSDTLMQSSTLLTCFEFMDSEFAIRHNIGLIGCRLLSGDGTEQTSYFFDASLFGYFVGGNPILSRILPPNRYLNAKRKFEDGWFVTGVSGAFMFFRREVFQLVAPFDPDFFMYCEETDLCRNRVSKYFKIFHYRNATVVHFGGKSSSNNQRLYQNMGSFALSWYKKGPFKYALYIIISALNFISYLLVLPISRKGGFSREIIRGYLKISKYVLFDIPKYPRKWGGRPQPLVIR